MSGSIELTTMSNPTTSSPLSSSGSVGSLEGRAVTASPKKGLMGQLIDAVVRFFSSFQKSVDKDLGNGAIGYRPEFSNHSIVTGHGKAFGSLDYKLVSIQSQNGPVIFYKERGNSSFRMATFDRENFNIDNKGSRALNEREMRMELANSLSPGSQLQSFSSLVDYLNS